MTAQPPDGAPDRVLVFENDPHQAAAYRELFLARGCLAETALPDQDVQAVCERFRPDLVVFDMAFWEADTAYVFGILNSGLGFARPVIIALCTLDMHKRRARRFGADAVWVRGVDDAAGLPQLAAELTQKRRDGALKAPQPSTPL